MCHWMGAVLWSGAAPFARRWFGAAGNGRENHAGTAMASKFVIGCLPASINENKDAFKSHFKSITERFTVLIIHIFFIPTRTNPIYKQQNAFLVHCLA